MATRRIHPQESRHWKCRGRYLARGRLRGPFEDYQRLQLPHSVEDDGRAAVFGARLTLVQTALVLKRLAQRNTERPLKGPRFAARVAGIVSSVKNGRVGNAAWGWSMHGKRGGQTMARHALHHLRAIASAGARASVIARERKKAREDFDPDHGPA